MRGGEGALFNLLIFLFAVPAAAQDQFPALFDVTGLASDDVLNVRAEQSANSEIISTLRSDHSGIEVIHTSEDREWGLINIGESSGWTSMHFLKRRPSLPIWELHSTLSCFGTEPFWTLSHQGDFNGTWITPEGTNDVVFGEMILAKLGPSRFGLTASYRAISQNFDHGQVTLDGIVRRETCGDGMSNNVFGFSIDLLQRHFHLSTILSGCCSVAP